jgi:hypothetical protein
MIRKSFASMALIAIATVTAAGPRGTTPKASPGEYPAHAQRDGVAIGVSLVPFGQTMKTFNSSFIDRCCVVVEVALYPEKDSQLSVSMDDFTMQVPGNDAIIHPITAQAVATTIEQYQEDGKMVTTTHVGVGHEWGTEIDPMTGQPRKVNGTITEAGAGVGNEPSNSPPPRAVIQAVEDKVAEKALPEGTTATAVAGYLYFSRSMITKKKKNTPLEFHYEWKDQSVVLSLP